MFKAISKIMTRALTAAHLNLHTSRERGLFRGWLNITGPGGRYDSLASFEVSAGGFHLGASVALVDDCEGGLRMAFGLGPVRIFLGSEHRSMVALAKRLAPYMGKDFYGQRKAKVGAELYACDGEVIGRLHLGGNEESSTGPSHYYNLKDIVLGRAKYTEGDGEQEARTVHLAEGAYTLGLSRNLSTWKRPRWPVATRSESYNWEVISGPDGRKGLPVPGKGENSYDCDEDAVSAGSIQARNADEAAGKVIGMVMRDRARRAGPDWMPEPAKARDPSPTFPPEAMSA
jgi:hypothetical protein